MVYSTETLLFYTGIKVPAMEYALVGQGRFSAFLSILLQPLEFLPELEFKYVSWRMKTLCPFFLLLFGFVVVVVSRLSVCFTSTWFVMSIVVLLFR